MSKANEPPDPDAHLVGENESRLLDTSGAEELSVKTLADMFDFRVGEQVNTFWHLLLQELLIKIPNFQIWKKIHCKEEEEEVREHIATKVTFAPVDQN